MLCGVAPLPRWLRPAVCVPLYALLICCTSLLYSLRTTCSEFENLLPSRESYGFESQTSCLRRNRSRGLS